MRRSPDETARAEEIRQQISRFGGYVSLRNVRGEVKRLPQVLEDDETIKGLASGRMSIADLKSWLIICTDRRVLFLDKDIIVGMKQIDIPLEAISSVTYRTGVIYGSISILGSGLSGMTGRMIAKRDVPPLAKAIQTARRDYQAGLR